MPEIQDLGPQLDKLLTELDSRAKVVKKNHRYYEGGCPIPQVVESARLTKAYKLLMPMAEAPWASLVVDSVQDRLEVGGIRTGDKDLDKLIWREAWQANALDAESKLAHNSALINGRVHATVWPDAEGKPEIVYDPADQVVLRYREGRHQARHRVAALRRWVDEDDGKERLTLYTPDSLYKFREAKDQTEGRARVRAREKWWEQREEIGRDGDPEPWPLDNPLGVLPVVEIGTNRMLKSGSFSHARGEFQHCTGLIDRINLLTFLGLVVAVWMGFPLRGVIGEKILRDDDGQALPPFNQKPDEVVQFENLAAKTFEFKAADRGNLSIFPELAQLAYVTKTPAHYFPIEAGLANISADAIRALEGGLHAKVDGIHQPFLGEGHEETLRVAALVLGEDVEIPPTAELQWLDHESRSMAERADAATKVSSLGLPPLFIAEKFLNFTQEEIGRIETMVAGSALDELLRAAQRPAPALNGGAG